jgi:hypothetical protein
VLVSEVPLDLNSISLVRYTLDTYGSDVKPQKLIIRYDSPFVPSPIAPKISALLSIALMRRVATCNRSFRKAIPQNCTKNSTRSLFSKECKSRFPPLPLGQPQLSLNEQRERLNIFENLYTSIESLARIDQEVPLKAVEIYQLSKMAQAESLDLAYALLVVAIETIANDRKFVNLEANWENYGRKNEWDRFFEDELMDSELATRIRKKLEMGDISISQKKFSRFLIDYLPASFWSEGPTMLSPVTDVRQILKRDLAKILKTLYHIRSNLFHSGHSVGGDVGGYGEEILIPNPIYAESQRLLDGEDIESVKESRSPELPLIPNYNLFDRMARDSILNALKIDLS